MKENWKTKDGRIKENGGTVWRVDSVKKRYKTVGKVEEFVYWEYS